MARDNGTLEGWKEGLHDCKETELEKKARSNQAGSWGLGQAMLACGLRIEGNYKVLKKDLHFEKVNLVQYRE